MRSELLSKLVLIILLAAGLAACQTAALLPNSDQTTSPEIRSVAPPPPLKWDSVDPKHRAHPVGNLPNQADASAASAHPLAGSLWLRLRTGMDTASLGGGSAELRLKSHERWYRDRPEHLQRVFNRARPYLFDILNAVERAGLPAEVALLPAIESAFLPQAVSSAQADGLWQFIVPTAHRFKLRKNLFLDERRSTVAATHAALQYLSELRRRYGCMQLAFAAYNCGEGCIDAHIRRAKARGLLGRFEDLQLNSETANYVPRLLALAKLVAEAVDAADLKTFGLPPIQDVPTVASVQVGRDMDKSLVAKLAGLSLSQFETLNPQFKKPLIVASADQSLVLPIENLTQFRRGLATHQGALTTWAAVKINKHTDQESLAKAHGMSLQDFRAVNRIDNKGHLVAAGSTVLVPRVAAHGDIHEQTMLHAVLNTVPVLSVRRVQVRKGWRWQEVADHLQVAEAALRQANAGTRLKAGWVKLKVPIASFAEQSQTGLDPRLAQG